MSQFLRELTDSNVASSGYFRLPGGLIIQWGVTPDPADAASGSVTANFPIPFPVGLLAASCLESANALNKSAWSYGGATKTQITFNYFRVQGTAVGPAMFVAIGH